MAGTSFPARMDAPDFLEVYAYSGEAVEILRILHGKRNITRRRVQR